MSAVTDECCLDDLYRAPLQDIMCTLNKMGAKKSDNKTNLQQVSMCLLSDETRKSDGRIGVVVCDSGMSAGGNTDSLAFIDKVWQV